MHYFCDSHLISADTSKNANFNISIRRNKKSDKLAATITYNTRMKNIFQEKGVSYDLSWYFWYIYSIFLDRITNILMKKLKMSSSLGNLT